MNDGAVFCQCGGLDQFVVPLHRERLGRFVDQRLDEGKQIARIEARRGGRDAAPAVGEAADPLTLPLPPPPTPRGRRAGAGRPGISAVVMMMSCFLICSAVSAACLA